MSRWPAAALAAAALLATAACGATTDTAATSQAPTSPSPSTSASAPASPSSSPALMFKLNGVNGATASGAIALTSSSETMTLEIHITGLAPDSSHVSHVHTGSCQHPGGIIFALNQVIADGTGAADTRTTVQAKYPPPSGQHWYVVVHAGPDMQGANATYLMCGNLFS